MTFVVLDIETVPDRARWTPPAENPDAFPPTWAHKIVCVGYLALDEKYNPITSGTLVGPEREILDRLAYRMAKAPTIISYNGRSFDMPVILQRSLACAVPQPWFYSDRDYRYRYSDRLHIDLCDQLSEHGAAKMATLDVMAKLVGLPGKQGVDGSNVDQLFTAGRIDDIAKYCLDDVRQTAILFMNTWFLRGHFQPLELESRIMGIETHFAQPREERKSA